MNYNPSNPQPFDVPLESQPEFLNNFSTLNDFFGMNHIPFGNVLVTATLTNPCRVTSPNHRLTTGDTVTPTHMKGVNQTAVVEWDNNGTPTTVTVIDENTFDLDSVDSTNFPEYILESGDWSSVSIPYGYHTRSDFKTPINSPNLSGTVVSAYTKLFENISQACFQNGNTTAFEKQLTGASFVKTSQGTGWKSPWGIIFNMGMVTSSNDGDPHTFPVPYTNATLPLFIIATTTRLGQFNTGVVGVKNGTETNTGFTLVNNSPNQTVDAYYWSAGI